MENQQRLRQRSRPLAVLLLTFLLLSSACTKAYVNHPGSINSVDSRAYDTLIAYHDTIESAKADYTSGIFPAASKDILNKFIDAYNGLQGAYVAYHTAASPNPDATALNQAIANAAAAFADLVKTYPKVATAPAAATNPAKSSATSVGGVK